MSPEIFRKALLATARVACCSALLSCTPRTEEKKPEGAAPQPTVAAPLTPPPESRPASASVPASVPADPLEACRTHVHAVFVLKSEAASPRTTECCTKVADSIGVGGTGTWRERSQCCELLGWSGPAACMPWGPPRPPRMGPARLRPGVVARLAPADAPRGVA
jgi:hypothetical protein